MDTQGIRTLSASSGRLLAGLVGLTLLAGCSDDETRFVSAPEVKAGNSIEGELTSTSPVNLDSGTRYSAHWLCGSADAKRYRYTLEAPFAATLTAFDDEGHWLGAAESGPGGESALLLSAPEAQRCNLVVVNGSSGGAFGPYTLAAEAADEADTLTPDQPLIGQLKDGGAEYSLSLDAPAHLNLALSGAEGLDMRLLGEDVSQRAESCAPGELRLDAYLEPGDYRVQLGQAPKPNVAATECASHLLSTGGVYQLLASQRDLSEGRRNGGPLRDGDRITGNLEAGAPNAYALHLDAPSEVVLDLGSADFDTVLRVTGDGTDVSNDDTGSGTDSRVQTVLMAGDYRVEVSSYDGNPGEYRLEMRRGEFDGEFRNDGAIAAGEEVRGQYIGVGENRYRFTVEETAEVNLALDSLDFDPMLHLQGNGVDISDDDSGGDRNSLINAVLEPGDYTLEVQSYSGSGVYTLSAESSPFEGRMSDGGEIAPGETVFGRLTPGGRLSYRLVVDESREVTLESTSSAVDTVMQLTGKGVDEQNDDAPDLGLGSRITKRLEPGSYDIDIRGFGSGVGMVRLSIGE
ncbi:pre-peptidase C-terminal domain-containing protein [Halomonas getboli]|uniref:pre-peptidase C-terminal domain-containing protein n=1 Tax=Halomonas getboli TaxID=2935862 RepID=UPI001FFF2AEE|nr:pre-peptidase C-terminal domain-containing protein [Halomonas getboli]MCK2185293.1 hypothetical protein [Halomonas getboli]